MTRNVTKYSKSVVSLVLLVACSLAVQAAAPAGWRLNQTKLGTYEAGTDAQAAYNGHPSAYLKCTKPAVGEIANLMQHFRADKYAGKRVRLSAFVKTEALDEQGHLWMQWVRQSKDGGQTGASFAWLPKGSADWQNYEAVLDVPQYADSIEFGVFLSGPGTIWLNSVVFEIVGPDVPITGKKRSSLADESANFNDEPTNLNFEKP
jgi:hypothetical protein